MRYKTRQIRVPDRLRGVPTRPGDRFGRLVVKEQDLSRGSRPTRWICLCDCGGTLSTIDAVLKRGVTRSCGCLRREVIRQAQNKHRTHGLSQTPIYRVWIGMKTRCYNENDTNYWNYGRRGIRVCTRWQSFENFYEDMGDRPPGMSLDRIDPDGDYEPGNVRWATRSEQARNKRRRLPSAPIKRDRSRIWKEELRERMKARLCRVCRRKTRRRDGTCRFCDQQRRSQ